MFYIQSRHSRALQLAVVITFFFLPTIVGTRAMGGDTPDRKPDAEFRPALDGQMIGRSIFTPDGTTVVGLGEDTRKKQGLIDFWDVKTRKLTRSLVQPAMVTVAVFTPDGQRLVTAGWNKKMHIFAAPSWEMEHTFDYDPPNKTVQSIVMLPDGKRFLTSSHGKVGPRVWDIETRKAVAIDAPRQRINHFAVSKDGKRVAIAYSGAITEVRDTEKLQLIGKLHLKTGEESYGVFTSVAFSPDGRTIATAYEGKLGDYPIAIWEAATFRKLRDCRGFGQRAVGAAAIAFTPDSKLIVSCMGPEPSLPGKVFIWEVETGKLAYQFNSSNHGGSQMALSPDGKCLATCDLDSTIRLWNFEEIRDVIKKCEKQRGHP